jgi:DNA-binding response OmpR family regulator
MRILIAEDDLDISTLYKKALEKNKHQVVITSTGEECLNNYRTTLKNRSSKALLPRTADAEATVTDSFRD